jgi:hypothetical protein
MKQVEKSALTAPLFLEQVMFSDLRACV